MQISNQARRFREGRYTLLVAIALAGFALVIIGLLQLQVVDHDKYVLLSKENRVRLEVIRAPRGSIYDRHGGLLADSAPSFSIVYRPFPVESTERVVPQMRPDWTPRVASLTGLDTSEVRARIAFANRSGQTAILRRDAPFAVLAAVEETRSELPGIETQVEPLRHYPHGALAAHLLGYAGEINQDELDARADHGYHLGDLVGRTGVEKSFEDILRGRDGAEFVVVNAMGRRVAKLSEGPRQQPVPGHDIVLTLDLKVQKAMEEAMAGVERGAAVALDPRDGSILGLVSRPAFDPNEFSHGLSQARWDKLSSGGANPLLDRAIQGVYPPGSTFKTVTMTAALRSGVVSPGTRLEPCYGGYQFGARWFACWKKAGHGSLDLIGALENSCDTYFYQLGPKVGLTPLEEAARGYGLGNRTGVDLPQEARGLIPSIAWYDKRWGTGRWPKGLLLNLAIGQGELLVTPLQLALLMAEVAEDGRPIRPHLVEAVRGVTEFHPDKPPQPGVDASPSVWRALQKGLEAVVATGTGTAARVPGVRVAGKTGTAQNPHGKDHALFACYAPVDSPSIALAFVVENSGHGGSIAAPLAARVLRRVLLPDSLQALPLPRVHVPRPDTTRVDTTEARDED
ncbi:MAG TPA: penicillin-binding protein 2 [Candidatus Eisenbacteria bacterium]